MLTWRDGATSREAGEEAGTRPWGFSHTCSFLTGDTVRARDSRGLLRQLGLLRFASLRERKGFRPSSPHVAALNANQGPRGHSVRAQFTQLRNKGEAAPDMRSRCPRGHMDGLEPGPGVEGRTHMEQRDLRRGVPGTPSLHPSSFAPRNPENPHWRAAAEPETQVHGVPTTSCHGHCGRRSACS